MTMSTKHLQNWRNYVQSLPNNCDINIDARANFDAYLEFWRHENQGTNKPEPRFEDWLVAWRMGHNHLAQMF
jgi:hypothetical protein